MYQILISLSRIMSMLSIKREERNNSLNNKESFFYEILLTPVQRLSGYFSNKRKIEEALVLFF